MGKGGTTVHERQPTDEERRLIAMQTKYAETLHPAVNELTARGMSAMKDVITPDYKGIYADTQRRTEGIMADADNLSAGNLPSAYLDNKRNYYAQLGKSGFGDIIGNAARRGVINSSVTEKATNDFNENLSAQMAKDWKSDIATQSGLLSQRTDLLNRPFQTANMANASTFGNVAQHLGLATGSNANNNQTLATVGQLANGRAYVENDPGFFGGMMSGLGSYFGACFVAGTMIATPDGDKPIEDIVVGDSVYSFDDDGEITTETVTFVNEPRISLDDYVFVLGEDGNRIDTTSTQRLLDIEGNFEYVERLLGEHVITFDNATSVAFVGAGRTREIVYDFATSGRNIYFANGFAVEGADINAGD